MQPLVSTTIRRPFHWGIVVLADADSGGRIPDVNPEESVTGNEHGVVALIRHAQDIDSFDGDFDWAEAQVLVRLLPEEEALAAGRRVIFRGRVLASSGRISVGDADGEIIHPAHHGWNEVVVTVAADLPVTDLSPDELRVDLLPTS